MTKKLEEIKQFKIERPKKAKLSPEESLERMQAFAERKERFVVAVRKSKD